MNIISWHEKYIKYVKDQVSSFKILDLVVVQTSATKLTKFENPKSIKRNRRQKFSDKPPKIIQGT
jgi:hypothetical protein